MDSWPFDPYYNYIPHVINPEDVAPQYLPVAVSAFEAPGIPVPQGNINDATCVTDAKKFGVDLTDAKLRKHSKQLQQRVCRNLAGRANLLDMLEPRGKQLVCSGGCSIKTIKNDTMTKERHLYQTSSHWKAVAMKLDFDGWERIYEDHLIWVKCPVVNCSVQLYVGSRAIAIDRHLRTHSSDDLQALLGKTLKWNGMDFKIIIK